MEITLRNNLFDASYPDNTDISHLNQDVVIIPIDIFHTLPQKYKEDGYDVENGLHGLPSPLAILTGDDLVAVKIATARFNRKKLENTGVSWNDYRFKTDTNTCQNLVTAVQGMQTGMIANETVPWRDVDGKFGDFTITQLQEIAVVVMTATEENFAAERAEIED